MTSFAAFACTFAVLPDVELPLLWHFRVTSKRVAQQYSALQTADLSRNAGSGVTTEHAVFADARDTVPDTCRTERSDASNRSIAPA